MEESSAQAVVNALAQVLGLPVVLEDLDQQPIAFSPHYELSDQIRRDTIMRKSTSQAVVDYFTPWGVRERRDPFVVPGNPDIEVLPRLCIPICSGSGTLGFVWVLLETPRVDAQQMRAAREAADALRNQMLTDHRSRQAGSEIVRGILSQEYSERMRALAELDGRHRVGIDRSCAILVCSGGPWREPAVRSRFWQVGWVDRPQDQVCAVIDGEGVVILVVDALGPDGRRRHARAIGDMRRAAVIDPAPDGPLCAGVSSIVPSPAELHGAYREARLALRVSSHIPPPNAVSYWDEMGVFRFLAQMSPDMLAKAVDPRLAELVEAAPELAHTLERYLACAGSASSVATGLALHRTTLYKRLERISNFGIDVREGRDRMSMHAGIYALRLLDRWPGPAMSVD